MQTAGLPVQPEEPLQPQTAGLPELPGKPLQPQAAGLPAQPWNPLQLQAAGLSEQPAEWAECQPISGMPWHRSPGRPRRAFEQRRAVSPLRRAVHQKAQEGWPQAAATSGSRPPARFTPRAV